jgi:hypothetical protein
MTAQREKVQPGRIASDWAVWWFKMEFFNEMDDLNVEFIAL